MSETVHMRLLIGPCGRRLRLSPQNLNLAPTIRNELLLSLKAAVAGKFVKIERTTRAKGKVRQREIIMINIDKRVGRNEPLWCDASDRVAVVCIDVAPWSTREIRKRSAAPTVITHVRCGATGRDIPNRPSVEPRNIYSSILGDGDRAESFVERSRQTGGAAVGLVDVWPAARLTDTR